MIKASKWKSSDHFSINANKREKLQKQTYLWNLQTLTDTFCQVQVGSKTTKQ